MIEKLHKKTLFLALGILSLFSTTLEAQSPFDYEGLDALLSEHVVPLKGSTRVKYKKLKSNSAKLIAVTQQFSAINKEDFQQWPEAERLAFLINAYNIFTLQLIVNHYPVESIRDIGGLFSSPWKKRFFTLLGEKMHLDQIEHEIIRVEYKEDRIHFAVNCASIGCPPLQPVAFKGATLDTQLEDASKAFLQNKDFNYFDPKKMEWKLSSIFKWYGDDFGSEEQLKEKIYQWMGLKPAETPKKAAIKADIDYLDYDWNLNEAP